MLWVLWSPESNLDPVRQVKSINKVLTTTMKEPQRYMLIPIIWRIWDWLLLCYWSSFKASSYQYFRKHQGYLGNASKSTNNYVMIKLGMWIKRLHSVSYSSQPWQHTFVLILVLICSERLEKHDGNGQWTSWSCFMLGCSVMALCLVLQLFAISWWTGCLHR